VQQIRSFITQEDDAAVYRLAHNLKGVAGNLGVGEVQTLADSLGKLPDVHQQPEMVEALLLRLEAAVLESSAVIRRHCGPAEQFRSASSGLELELADEPLSLIAGKLLGMLKDSDSEAVDYFVSVRRQLAVYLETGQLIRLEDDLNRFEYEEAIEIIEAAIRESNYEQRLI
jgi:HPt (histidine-containing phosphotransfer) domain-containing protein